METHILWWQMVLLYMKKFVTWLQAHQGPCQSLQHKTLRFGCHPYPREINTIVPKCHIHTFSTNAREIQDKMRFSLPKRRKKNQRIQCYSPGKYLEMNHLFSIRKELPTINTMTSKARLCTGRSVYKVPFGPNDLSFQAHVFQWFSLSPVMSLHMPFHCSLIPIVLGRCV